MKKFLKARKAKGFTLVELLIVLIIIGILAGALLLVAGAGTDKANATKIVSNMRSAKAAALMVYADENGGWNWVSASADAYKKYMDKGSATDKITIVSADSNIWVYYNDASGDTTVTDGVAEKLVQLKDSGVPLYQSTTATSPDYATGGSVYLPLTGN
ncbi:MAG: prepilin-type N-terminal cleavage/methylation domain-containing protein [Synergistales bacterium]|jgi:general secretion pathway protein G